MKNIKRLKEVIKDFSFLEALQEDLDQYKALDNFKQKTIILIGIGGSALGAQLLSNINPKSDKQLIIVDHIQPEVINNILELEPSEVLIVIQTKSGNTLETINLAEIFIKWFEDNNLEIKNNFIICTEKQSNLEKRFQSFNVLQFELNSKIGGRFSVLTCMGLVIAKLLDINVLDLIEGAKQALKTDQSSIEEIANTIVDNKIKILTVFNYNYLIPDISSWITQLVSESLGKNSNELLPFNLQGPKDQHSALQMLIDGSKNKFVMFIPPYITQDVQIPNQKYSLHDQLMAEYKGTFRSISNRHTTFEFDECVNITNYLGKIIVFFELLVAYIGFIQGINPFDQPAVEESKLITNQILKLL
ncbi:MAG: hypothetical protein ACRCXZ_05570 [Patescibacteria group bacterium]